MEHNNGIERGFEWCSVRPLVVLVNPHHISNRCTRFLIGTCGGAWINVTEKIGGIEVDTCTLNVGEINTYVNEITLCYSNYPRAKQKNRC